MRYPAPNDQLARKLNIASIIISIAVLALVGVMRQVKIDLGVDFSFLPPIHAVLNPLVTICLLAAIYFIKRKEQLGRHLLRVRSLVRDVLEELQPDSAWLDEAAVLAEAQERSS